MEQSHASKPLIVAVGDVREDARRVERELQTRYQADYRIVCPDSAEARLAALRRFAAGEPVALVLADQRLGGGGGVEFLARVRGLYPTAKRSPLTIPLERSSGATLPQAQALGRIDYFEPLPGPPPNERFHQIVTGFLEEWSSPRRSETHPARIGGEGAVAIQQVHECLRQVPAPPGGARLGAESDGEAARTRQWSA